MNLKGKFVVDVNLFRKPILEELLRYRAGNKAVITATATHETFKGNSVDNLHRSLEILKKYPRQVLILKPITDCYNAGGTVKQVRRRLISREGTNDFPKFCSQVAEAKGGHPSYAATLERDGLQLKAYFDRTQEIEWPVHRERLIELRDRLGCDIVKVIKRPSPKKDLKPAVEETVRFVSEMYQRASNEAGIPFERELRRADLRARPLYRWTLAHAGLYLAWISQGGVENLSDRQGRNDLLDLEYVVMATYFDGLLSLDSRMKTVCNWTMSLLRNL